MQETIHSNPCSDQEFMTWLYHNYQRMIYATAGKYHSDPDQCADIVQEASLKLVEKVTLLRGLSQGALTNYILVTTRNTAITHLKKQQSRESKVIGFDELSGDVRSGSHETLDRHFIPEERKEKIREIWPQLDEGSRYALEGKYFLDYDDRELAQLLGCKTASVRMKLTRARHRCGNFWKKGDELDKARSII